MMRWAAPYAAAACLCCSAVQASSIDGYSFADPPAEFSHEPERPYAVNRVTAQLVDIMCGVVLGRVVLGCTLDDGKKPVIFIKEGLSPELEAAVLAHEKAHVNGWEHG
jgi:hypothetical protein